MTRYETYENMGKVDVDMIRPLGFVYYDRKKKVSMVYPLTQMMIPMHIHTSWGEELVANDSSYMIILNPVEPNESRPIHQLDRWPCQWDAFADSYKPFRVPVEDLTLAEQSLVAQGARPYYKFVGVWAKLITKPTQIRGGLEHGDRTVEVPIGNVLALGVDGEPYSMTRSKFEELYIVGDGELDR